MTTTQTQTTVSRHPAPAAPAPVPALPRLLGRHRRSVALGLLVSAQFVVMLDTSIVNVALPSIQADLGLGPTGITWVVNAYVLAFGSLLLMSGRAADLFGRRRMFVAGSTLFTAGTLLAAAAANPAMLVAGRIIQGAGAAALSPAAMSLLLLTFPGPARARAMSIWGAASGLGGATGVFLGGLLAGTFGWSSVFLVTVPVSVAAVLLARQVLEEGPRGARRRFDWRGAATITGAVIALVHAALGGRRERMDLHPRPGQPRRLRRAPGGVRGARAPHRRPAGAPRAASGPGSCAPVVALAVFGGAARASAFVLVALYLQQALAMAPQRAGTGHGPHLGHRLRRLARAAAAAAARPRSATHHGDRTGGAGRRSPVAGARTGRTPATWSRFCPGCCSSPSASRSASCPPPWSSPPRRPMLTQGSRPGWPARRARSARRSARPRSPRSASRQVARAPAP